MAAPLSRLNTFATLSAKYPTWPALKEYLVVSEPHVEILEFENSPYVILKNREVHTDSANGSNSATEDSTSEVSQLCRSVVWNTLTNIPCCVAPFAARRDQKIPLNEPLRIEDFVEGVMINIFRVSGDPVTHVTTRSKLDADGKFYSEHTFRELFDEAMDAQKVTLEDLEASMGSPDQEGVSATFMSLVLAHPEHRVVKTVHKPTFWVIFSGTVTADGTVKFYTDTIASHWRPQTYPSASVSEWSDLKNKFEEIKKTKSWDWQGLVVHNGLQRWRFRNAQHDHVRRDLRGSESNPFGRFLRLRANKKIKEYLRVYPEDSKAFDGYEHEYRQTTKILYAWYCRCHKEHSVIFKSLPTSVQPLVFGLHKTYLEKFRPNKQTLRLTETIDWVLEHLTTDYGVPNFIRLSKETVQPPDASEARAPAATKPMFREEA